MKHRVLTLLIFLLLGAIVNIAVAWGLSSSINSATQSPDYAWHTTVHVRADGTRWQWCIGSLDGTGVTIAFIGAVPALPRLVPSNTEFDLKFALQHERLAKGMRHYESICKQESRPSGFFSWRASGWPCHALACEWPWWTPSQWPNPPIAGGFALSPFDASKPYSWLHLRVLPLRPLWPGFAINTLFYAAILWMLFTCRLVLPYGRRWRRIKRGLCPSCAYPVGTSDLCTECGHKLNITSKIARERMGLPPPATPALEAERKP